MEVMVFNEVKRAEPVFLCPICGEEPQVGITYYHISGIHINDVTICYCCHGLELILTVAASDMPAPDAKHVLKNYNVIQTIVKETLIESNSLYLILKSYKWQNKYEEST